MRNVIYLVFTLSSAVSCFGQGKQAPSSPSDVVKAFYAACNAGRYSEAEMYLTPAAREFMKGQAAARTGASLKDYCDGQTKKGTVLRTDIFKVDVRGEEAEVLFTIYYRGGGSKEDHESLIKKDGAWKIGIGR